MESFWSASLEPEYLHMIRKSLNQILKSLTPIKGGDNIYKVITADRINNIQEALHLLTRGDNIISGVNVRKKSGDGYVSLSSNAGGGTGGGGGGLERPWQMHVTAIPGALQVRLNPGTINNMLPSNMFDVWTVPSTGLWYASLDATTNGYQVTNAVVDISENFADPAGIAMGLAPSYFSVQLGVINNGQTFDIFTDLMFATPTKVLTTVKGSLSPGQPIWDFWYTWVITSV